jgi:hypothetical protein
MEEVQLLVTRAEAKGDEAMTKLMRSGMLLEKHLLMVLHYMQLPFHDLLNMAWKEDTAAPWELEDAASCMMCNTAEYIGMFMGLHETKSEHQEAKQRLLQMLLLSGTWLRVGHACHAPLAVACICKQVRSL